MSPDPADTPALDPEDILWFSYDWCSLPWSPWVPFSAAKEEFREIPKEPGLYRIRPVGEDFLVYIGETKRTVHERLNELRQGMLQSPLMPWSDPNTAAPGLWAWHDAEAFEYECSATPLDASGSGRKGMETFLVYRYRQEHGESPLCNCGRFHPRYRRSTTRAENRRGGKLADHQQDNPAGLPGIPPLECHGRPGDRDWMDLEWSDLAPLTPETIRTVEPGAGLYLLSTPGTQEIVYIGESADCARRLLTHCHNEKGGLPLSFSYQIIGQKVLPHHLKELATDLVGNFFEHFRKPPEFQFRNSQ
jgi:hypothetical protein